MSRPDVSCLRASAEAEAWANHESSPRGSVFQKLATELIAEHEAALAEREREVAGLRLENRALHERLKLLRTTRDFSPPVPKGTLLELPTCDIPGVLTLEGGQDVAEPRALSKTTSKCGSSKNSKCSSGYSPSPRHRLGRPHSIDGSSGRARSRRGSDTFSSVTVASGFSIVDMEEIAAVAALGGKEEAMARKWETRNARRGSTRSHSEKKERRGSILMNSASDFSRRARHNCSTTRHIAVRVVNSWFFDISIGCVIVANAVTMGIETAHVVNDEPIPHIIEMLEAFFLTLYIIELWLRIHGEGLSAFKRAWIKFDAFLVAAGILDILAQSIASAIETSMVRNLTMVRLLRMIRVVRAARLLALAQFRTLWCLIEGLASSVNPMFWTLVIMVVHLYVFALFGMELIRTTPQYGEEYQEIAARHFSSVGRAMMTLVQIMTLDSVAAIYQPLTTARPELALYFFSFMLCCSISLMNLVTGIMVESAIRQAKEDQDARRAWEAMKRRQMRPKLQELFFLLDTNNSGELEIEELLAAPPALQDQLNRICNMDDIEETFKILDYDDSGSVDLDEFCNGVMRVQHTEKPAELIRLVRQCDDIQQSTRYLAKVMQSQLGDSR